MEDLLAIIAACTSIYALSFFHFTSAIPVGLALGLPPGLVVLTVTISYASGAAVVLFFGEGVRNWLGRRLRWATPAGKADELDPSDSRWQRVWERWGLPGIGLLAPVTVGAQVAAIIGLTLKVNNRRLFLWLAIGALIWAILLSAAISLGVLAIQSAAG